ncbi:hypothetical protein PV350_45880, partial [Streptomyces sp. PA03-6a]|nr:hypothetical protein [Streptomyces sp. PA03-6a]
SGGLPSAPVKAETDGPHAISGQEADDGAGSGREDGLALVSSGGLHPATGHASGTPRDDAAADAVAGETDDADGSTVAGETDDGTLVDTPDADGSIAAGDGVAAGVKEAGQRKNVLLGSELGDDRIRAWLAGASRDANPTDRYAAVLLDPDSRFPVEITANSAAVPATHSSVLGQGLDWSALPARERAAVEALVDRRLSGPMATAGWKPADWAAVAAARRRSHEAAAHVMLRLVKANHPNGFASYLAALDAARNTTFGFLNLDRELMAKGVNFLGLMWDIYAEKTHVTQMVHSWISSGITENWKSRNRGAVAMALKYSGTAAMAATAWDVAVAAPSRDPSDVLSRHFTATGPSWDSSDVLSRYYAALDEASADNAAGNLRQATDRILRAGKALKEEGVDVFRLKWWALSDSERSEVKRSVPRFVVPSRLAAWVTGLPDTARFSDLEWGAVAVAHREVHKDVAVVTAWQLSADPVRRWLSRPYIGMALVDNERMKEQVVRQYLDSLGTDEREALGQRLSSVLGPSSFRDVPESLRSSSGRSGGARADDDALAGSFRSDDEATVASSDADDGTRLIGGLGSEGKQPGHGTAAGAGGGLEHAEEVLAAVSPAAGGDALLQQTASVATGDTGEVHPSGPLSVPGIVPAAASPAPVSSGGQPRDVRHTVVHGSATETVTVRWESGDRSFPVLDEPAGVSARAVSAPAGAVDDILHGAGPGAGRVDLRLDAGWDAARGAAAPDTVKHSWVDPVSTPRGGGAHAPRYEVRAGYDVRRFELGGRPVTDLTVRVRLAGEGLSPAQVDALWDRALSGVERVFNRPGEVMRDGSVLHVTLERVAGNASDAHLNVNVGGSRGAMNQHQWRVDATEQDLAHELGHQLGLRDEYRDTTAGHRPEVDGSLMGNYH